MCFAVLENLIILLQRKLGQSKLMFRQICQHKDLIGVQTSGPEFPEHLPSLESKVCELVSVVSKLLQISPELKTDYNLQKGKQNCLTFKLFFTIFFQLIVKKNSYLAT